MLIINASNEGSLHISSTGGLLVVVVVVVVVVGVVVVEVVVLVVGTFVVLDQFFTRLAANILLIVGKLIK